LRKLLGNAVYKCKEEIYINENESVYPLIKITDGYIDTETGFIRLFGNFDVNEKKYYVVIYINSWKSDVFTEKNIESVEDVLKVEWIFFIYSLFLPEEKEDFYRLLESYENKTTEMEVK
jgi:tRNA A22 N-methylase